MKAQNRLPLIKNIFLILLSFFAVLNFSWKWIQAGSYAPDLGGFERNVIWGIQTIMSGSSLYSNPDASPFSLIQYMPLYYYGISWLAAVSGINPDDAHGVYQLARMFNLMTGLLLPGCIFILLRKKFALNLFPALCLSLFAFLLLGAFTLSGRPDTLKAFFFLLHLVLLIFYAGIRLRYLIPISLLLSLLCFSCKQDGLTAFGLLPLAFLMGREWRKFLISSIFSGLTVVACLLLMQGIFGGNFFPNVFGALENGISFSWFKSVFYLFFGQYALLFAPALVLSYEFSFEKSLIFRLLAAGFIIAFFPPLLAALKFGSGPNYFLEAILISCLLLGIAWKGKSGLSIFHFRESLTLFFLLIAALWFAVPAMEWTSGIFFHQENRLKQVYTSDLKVVTEIKKAYPEKQFMLLIGRQWEDNLSTLLWDCIINPNRDVSEQVFTGRKGNALHSLRDYVRKNPRVALLTGLAEVPAFSGMDFSGFRKDRTFGAYQIWVKNR